MKHAQASFVTAAGRSNRSIVVLAPALCSVFGLALLGACGGSKSGQNVFSGTSGTVVTHPDPGLGSRTLVLDENQQGRATAIRLTGVFWGRLAAIRDVTGALQQADMPIGEDIRTDGIDFTLSINPITEETSVTILHPFTPSAIVNGVETSPYQRAFAKLDQNLTPVNDKSISPSELPPFTMVPRNGALVLRFNDLLDTDTINAQTIKLFSGGPLDTDTTTEPFEARIIPDINHGGAVDRTGPSGAPDGVPEFYPTRVIVDTTVSPIESALANPPLAINALGFPGSTNSNQANIGIRIPSRIDAVAGQTVALANLDGGRLSTNNNGSVDTSSTTRDIVRALRSGGATDITGDVNNGFVIDDIPPRLVGTQPIGIGTPLPDGLGGYTATLVFQNNDGISGSLRNCKMSLKAGDVIQQPGLFAEVSQPATDIDNDGLNNNVFEVHFRVVFPAGGTLSAGLGQLTTLFDPVANANTSQCFVRFPSLVPNGDGTIGVGTDSSVILRFSEPMDPARLTAFDNFTVTRVNSSPTGKDFVVGGVVASGDLKEFRFSPTLPFQHAIGSAEDYFVNLASGANGPIDLAGNPLDVALPQIPFLLARPQPDQRNASLVLRFSSTDELPDNGGANRAEWRGQFLYDIAQGAIRPRSVSHFTAVADRTNAIVSNMPVAAQGVQTPLSSFGSRLQALWRYCDVGMGLLDEQNINIDVEGLAWAPKSGTPQADTFEGFRMLMAHSKFLPDETLNPALLPSFPASGLVGTFINNLVDTTNDPLFEVHPRERGYTILTSDVFQASSGTRMVPWPWNRQGINSPTDKRYYTWRDTTLQAKGAPSGPGAELQIVVNILGIGQPSVPFLAGNVPTIGLPLLMEFRCYPDTAAFGSNAIDVSFATNSSPQPNFRAFSTGGVSFGNQIVRDPDAQTSALGGFNPGANGAPTAGVDNTFYIGQMNLVTRISRVHSIWFDTTAATTQYNAPVVEPRLEDLPPGTQVVLAYRGATNVTGTPTNSTIANDALVLDAYGDPANTTTAGAPTFPNNDNKWKASLPSLNGLRWFQVRVSFVANIETSQTASLSALGFAWRF